MSGQTTLNPTHSATSSPESAGGALLSDLQAGQTIDLFGQEAAPASRSARREKEKAKQTSAICGRCGSALSVNPDRQLCMESKCQPLSVMVGGMTWPMIWKEKVTPRGRKLGQLVVLASPTSGTDYGLWQTPQTRDFRSGGASRFENPDRSKNLNDMALWATPNTMDGIGDRAEKSMEAMFQAARKGRTAPSNLREQVNPSMWPTPRANSSTEDIADLKNRSTKNGANLSGLVAQTENRGQLNPAFVCWLMGYSTAHLSSMHLAMQSFRKSRRSS